MTCSASFGPIQTAEGRRSVPPEPIEQHPYCPHCGQAKDLEQRYEQLDACHADLHLKVAEAEATIARLTQEQPVIQDMLAQALQDIEVFKRQVKQLEKESTDARQDLAAIVQEWKERLSHRRYVYEHQEFASVGGKVLHLGGTEMLESCIEKLDAWIAAQPPVRQET